MDKKLMHFFLSQNICLSAVSYSFIVFFSSSDCKFKEIPVFKWTLGKIP